MLEIYFCKREEDGAVELGVCRLIKISPSSSSESSPLRTSPPRPLALLANASLHRL